MSTIDSYSFISAMTIGRDFIWQLKGDPDETHLNTYTQIGLIATAVLTVVMALFFESIIDIWHDVGSVGTPALLIPLASAFYDRWKMRPKFALSAMISGGLVSLVWLGGSYFPLSAPSDVYFWGVEPIFPGLIVSVLLFIVDHLLRD